MTADPSAAQLARYRETAASLRGGELYDSLVRLLVIYAHKDLETRDAMLAKMAEFVKTAAKVQGKENGVLFTADDLAAIAGAVELDARAFLAHLPIEGGRA